MTSSSAAAVETAAASRATRPFAPFEWMVAFRYLRARNAQKSISVIAGFSFLGIVLGVAALIVVMSVMNGFRHDLMEKMIGLNGHMFLQGIEEPLTDYDAVTERVSKVPGVTLALPLVEGQAFATTQYGSAGALVRGVRQPDLERLPGVAGHITQGSLDGFDGGQGVAVGAKLAEHLGLRVGDKVTIIAPHGTQTPFGVTPRMKSYPVAAIFQIGMATFDNTFIFMPLAEAQTFFNQEGQANVIEVYVANPDDMDAMREDRASPAAADDRHRLAPAQSQLLRRAGGREQRDVRDPGADHAGRGAQHHFWAHHAGAGQGPRHCGLAHHGRDARRDHAHLPHHWRDDRRRRHLRGAHPRPVVAYNVEPIRRFLSWPTGQNLFPSEFYFLSQLPLRVETTDVLAGWGSRSCSRSRPRFIRRGGRPGSIRWRRCAMNDAGRFAALALSAVERRYGRGETTVEVLNGASLTLYAGQSVALIAPSGADAAQQPLKKMDAMPTLAVGMFSRVFTCPRQAWAWHPTNRNAGVLQWAVSRATAPCRTAASVAGRARTRGSSSLNSRLGWMSVLFWYLSLA